MYLDYMYVYIYNLDHILYILSTCSRHLVFYICFISYMYVHVCKGLCVRVCV